MQGDGSESGAGRANGGYGFGARFSRLLARRPALFQFVVAIVVARIVFSVLDLVESRVVGYSLVITAVLLVEVVVIWKRIGPQRGRTHIPRQGAEGTRLDRSLQLTERFGAAAVYVTTALVLVAELVLALRHSSRSALLDMTAAIRWVELVALVLVILAARSWDRRFPEQMDRP